MERNAVVHNPFSLKGKKILVTGASSGIGRAIAVEAARAGAELVITARNVERLEATRRMIGDVSDARVDLLTADLTLEADIQQLVAALEGIDGVVVSVGTQQFVPLKIATPEKFHEMLSNNFTSSTELIRLLMKQKKLKMGGSVVLISSIGGNFCFQPGAALYGVSKAAMNAYMKFAAKEYATGLIRVNCICPGVVETPLLQNEVLSDASLDNIRNRIPLKRFGRPEEIGYAAVYLLSDAASWITGTSLRLDGGEAI